MELLKLRHIFCGSTIYSLWFKGYLPFNLGIFLLTLSKRQILDLSKLKEFAVDNSNFVANVRKLFKQVENTVGKGEIARYEQFLLFPHCFQKTCTADT